MDRMRLFFALLPDPDISVAIDDWRRRYLRLPPPARPVPVQNLHITLRFCGEVNEQQSRKLAGRARQIDAARISMPLNVAGYFANTGISWLGSDAIEPDLLSLHKQLATTTERRFIPHVTLYRGITSPPPPPLMPPSFDLLFSSFALMTSMRGRNGVRYDPVEIFPLT